MAAVVVPRREPIAPVSPAPSLDAEELATLIKRGHDFLKAGDIPSARLVLRRAANAGNAQAALALGGTYDGVLLAELGVLGFAADTAQARTWYQRALELGSPEASRRLDRLAGLER
jgi:TPR repeat protein